MDKLTKEERLELKKVRQENERIRKEQEQYLIKLHKEAEIAEELHRKNIGPAPSDAYIILKGINKVYDNNVQAVFDFNLDIQKHEFIVFVGPSGCGKSTTLRMIAGLESITRGDLYIDGTYSNELTARERDVAMVFQNYALYPHMTVYENIAFGLRIRGYDAKTIDEKVKTTAEILQLTPYLKRRPKEMSGGQQQRAALGRAISRDAKVFLMDEPLSNLDAKLRVSMRSEITRLHKALNATTIYVTHDQTEAMTMADRIVVMKDGYIQQIGTPEVIYNNPVNMFVATFIGAPAMNLLNAKYTKKNIEFDNGFKIPVTKEIKAKHDEFYKNEIERIKLDIQNEVYKIPDGNLVLTAKKKKRTLKEIINGVEDFVPIKTPEEKLIELEELIVTYTKYLEEDHPIKFGVRPEDLYFSDVFDNSVKPSKPLEVTSELVELLGAKYYVYIKDFGDTIIGEAKANQKLHSGEKIQMYVDTNKIHLFDIISTKAFY